VTAIRNDFMALSSGVGVVHGLWRVLRALAYEPLPRREGTCLPAPPPRGACSNAVARSWVMRRLLPLRTCNLLNRDITLPCLLD
jgi:hypothetical protein